VFDSGYRHPIKGYLCPAGGDPPSWAGNWSVRKTLILPGLWQDSIWYWSTPDLQGSYCDSLLPERGGHQGGYSGTYSSVSTWSRPVTIFGSSDQHRFEVPEFAHRATGRPE
jgi:hypothetical protein